MKFSGIIKRFSRSRKATRPVVMFDIGSASIGGAVVFFDKEIPNITYCKRIQLPFQEEADERHFLSQIEEILTQIVNDIQKNGLQSKNGQSIIPQEIVCVLSSLWSDTKTVSASFEHKEKFIVTNNIMDDLLSQIHEKNEEERKGSIVVIEEVIISSLLNGYPTQLPLEKETQRINVTFLESTVTKELHTKINDVIHKVFSPDIPLLFRSFTLVAFSVTRDMFEDIRDFFLVDVTGEITELAVIKDSILGDVLSFPYGRNTIVRDIAKKTNSIPEDVLARIKIAFASDSSDMKETIFEEEKQWTEMFGRACGELSSEINPLPQNVFLIANTDYEDWFRKMIERVDFSQFTATREAFNVNFLIGKNIDEVCTLSNEVVQDSFLIMDSLFYNREYLYREL